MGTNKTVQRKKLQNSPQHSSREAWGTCHVLPSWGMQVTHTFSCLESFELGSFSFNHLMNFYARCAHLSPSVCPKVSMNIWHAITGSGSQAWLNCSPSIAEAQPGTPGKSRAQRTHSKTQPAPRSSSTRLPRDSSTKRKSAN